MPTDVKTAPTEYRSLEGKSFRFQTEAERRQVIDEAFDYRGDVTLEMATGEPIIAFVSNRDAFSTPPSLQIFIKGESRPRTIPYSEVTGITFSGEDTANGKSWQDWEKKHDSEKKAEAEKIKQQLAADGHL